MQMFKVNETVFTEMFDKILLTFWQKTFHFTLNTKNMVY